MKIDLTDMLYAMSSALDSVEQELLGVTTGHGKRVAYLSLLMARACGISGTELVDFVGCAILHDNALSEYIWEEYVKQDRQADLAKKPALHTSQHCISGEKNIRLIPFRSGVQGIILYHHENADGSGPLGKKEQEIGLKPQLLHLADLVDMHSDFTNMTEEDFDKLIEQVQNAKGRLVSEESVKAFMAAVDFPLVRKLQEKGALACLQEELPTEYHEYTDGEVRDLAEFFARIVDYKSPFTKNHSMGVAEKADIMAQFYLYPEDKAIRYYFAAALHDIGKLIVENDILEKPSKLDEKEFQVIQNHVWGSYEVFRRIKGMEDITKWVSHHHEKLDGSGYPFGLKADDLSHEERLLTCIDIYQALTEQRPYKDKLSHGEAIELMREMGEEGRIDSGIVNDLDKVFAGGA